MGVAHGQVFVHVDRHGTAIQQVQIGGHTVCHGGFLFAALLGQKGPKLLGGIGRLAEQNFPRGAQVKLINGILAALGGQVKGVQGIDLITPKFHTNRHFLVGSKNIHNIAAHRELAGAIHLGPAGVAGTKQSGQQVIPVQRGGGQFDRSYLDYYNIRAVDALEVGRNAFSCDSSWSNAPLWCTSGADVQGVLNSLNISSRLDELAAASSGAASEDADSGTVTAALPPLLPQRAEPHLPEPQSEEAARVQVHFGTRSATGFAYDETSGTYGMLRADGTPQTDANTGTQAQFDNLLILFSGSSLRDDQRTLDWLHGGNLWSITWTQGTDSTLAFYDADGRPLTLCNGRSYLALVSSVTGEEVGIQNTAGEELLTH